STARRIRRQANPSAIWGQVVVGQIAREIARPAGHQKPAGGDHMEKPGASLGRALLIEDDVDSAELLAQVLRRARFDVEVRTDPKEALELGLSQEFDVVLTDML